MNTIFTPVLWKQYITQYSFVAKGFAKMIQQFFYYHKLFISQLVYIVQTQLYIHVLSYQIICQNSYKQVIQ